MSALGPRLDLQEVTEAEAAHRACANASEALLSGLLAERQICDCWSAAGRQFTACPGIEPGRKG